MIVREKMGAYKTIKSCGALSHKSERKGSSGYTKMPKHDSVDWLLASRRVAPVKDTESFTVSSRIPILTKVIRWFGLH